MSNKEIQLFNFNGNNVRITDKDGDPWFIAKDVCVILGINNPRQAVSRLDVDERDGVITNDSIGRNQKITVVSESGLYSLIFTSRKAEAIAFRKWVTTEVLPSIRKNGSYSAVKMSRAQLAQMVIDESNEKEEVNKALQASERDLAKANELRKMLVHSKATYTSRDIGKELGLRSSQQFNKLINKDKIAFKGGDRWYLYADHTDRGLEKIKTKIEHHKNGDPFHVYTLEWTQTGRIFFLEKYGDCAVDKYKSYFGVE